MTESNVLYENGRIKVSYLPDSPIDHTLTIRAFRNSEGNEYFLGRGVLRQLADTEAGRLEGSLCLVHPHISEDLRSMGINVDRLHIALCQARMKEIELLAAYDRQTS